MSKIINFPVKKQNSNGYYNLVALFKICDNVESCNFYLDAAEHLFENDHITEKKLFTLRRIGRRKELNLRHQYREHRRQLNRALTFTPQKWDSKNLPNAK